MTEKIEENHLQVGLFLGRNLNQSFPDDEVRLYTLHSTSL